GAHDQLIGETELGIPNQDPARGDGQGRDEESDPEQELREAASRHVSASDNPGDQYRDGNGNALHQTGDHQGVEKGFADAWFAKGGAPCSKTKTPRTAPRLNLQPRN